MLQERRRARAALTAGLLALAAGGCTSRDLRAPPPLAEAPRPAPAVAPWAHPARYVAAHARQVGREGALVLAVTSGLRAELSGRALVRVAPLPAGLVDGAMAPSWTTTSPSPAPARYLAWTPDEIVGAQTFLGETRPLGPLPAPPSRSFDWLDGVGLATPVGLLAVRPDGRPPAPLDRPGAVLALASSARLGVVFTALGRAMLTIDGGRVYRDVTAALGEVDDLLWLAARDGSLVVALPGEREAAIDAAGTIAIGPARRGQHAPTTEPDEDDAWPDEDDAWPDDAPLDAIDVALSSGVALPGGRALAAHGGALFTIDLATGRAQRGASPGVDDADCAPIRLPDAVLLVCASGDRAVVVDVSAEPPRVERVFDLRDAPALDRFTGADGEALGFLGPCDERAPPLPFDVTSGASGLASSRARSPVFCARASRDTWIEHRLGPHDAAYAYAWAARPGGSAVAMVVLPGPVIADADRVTDRGGLRVVRVAREEPPLSLPDYDDGAMPVTLSRMVSVDADGSLRAWLRSASPMAGLLAVSIGPTGRVRALEPPSLSLGPVVAGRFAVAWSRDGALFETVDHGARWLRVAPPPGVAPSTEGTCSEAGCLFGDLARIGWSTPGQPSAASAPTGVVSPYAYARPPVDEPVARLSCRFTGPPSGASTVGLSGFGLSPSAPDRVASRLGSLGFARFPPDGASTSLRGHVEIAYVPLLDARGSIVRATIPLARAGLADAAERPYEVRLGHVIDAAGEVAPIVVGPAGACVAPLLALAGVTRPLAGCSGAATLGVDLGAQTLLVQSAPLAVAVSIVDSRRPGAAGDALAPSARPLRATSIAAPYGGSLAAAHRDDAAWLIAVDRDGRAEAARIDAASGRLGEAGPLASLADLRAGSDPACARAVPHEARAVLPLEGAIGLVPGGLPGVFATGEEGLAVIRWSAGRACVDALELAVRDERHEPEPSVGAPPGALRKLIVRRGPRGLAGTLVLVASGSELRQPVACDLAPR